MEIARTETGSSKSVSWYWCGVEEAGRKGGGEEKETGGSWESERSCAVVKSRKQTETDRCTKVRTFAVSMYLP